VFFCLPARRVARSEAHGGFVHAPETGGVVSTVQNWQANPYWSNGVDGAARPPA